MYTQACILLGKTEAFPGPFLSFFRPSQRSHEGLWDVATLPGSFLRSCHSESSEGRAGTSCQHDISWLLYCTNIHTNQTHKINTDAIMFTDNSTYRYRNILGITC